MKKGSINNKTRLICLLIATIMIVVVFVSAAGLNASDINTELSERDDDLKGLTFKKGTYLIVTAEFEANSSCDASCDLCDPLLGEPCGGSTAPSKGKFDLKEELGQWWKFCHYSDVKHIIDHCDPPNCPRAYGVATISPSFSVSGHNKMLSVTGGSLHEFAGWATDGYCPSCCISDSCGNSKFIEPLYIELPFTVTKPGGVLSVLMSGLRGFPYPSTQLFNLDGDAHLTWCVSDNSNNDLMMGWYDYNIKEGYYYQEIGDVDWPYDDGKIHLEPGDYKLKVTYNSSFGDSCWYDENGDGCDDHCMYGSVVAGTFDVQLTFEPDSE